MNKTMFILITLLGTFLHQSMVTPLGNLSGADFILLVSGLYVLVFRKVKLSKDYIMYTLFFLSYLTITSVFYTPIIFNVELSISSFSGAISRLLVLILYFFLGSNLSESNRINKLLTVYSNVAVIIGVLGLLLSVLPITLYNSKFFIFGTRFNGFMNDPNYFAVLQITGLPYFLRSFDEGKRKKISFIIIITSILLSGSKTGLLTLSLYLIFYIVENSIFSSKKNTIKKIVQNIIILLVISLGVIIVVTNFNFIISWINVKFPSTVRITTLFTDFESVFSSSGSARDLAWDNGLEIIKASPLFGVGIANYSNIASKYLGSGVIAHNTYIQLAAEWGLPVAILFFGVIFIIIMNIFLNKRTDKSLNVQKDIVIIFLIGSLGISLNNARFFWLILGSIVGSLKYSRGKYAE